MIALFSDRPLLSAIDMVSDMQYFLQAIGRSGDLLTLDMNETYHDTHLNRSFGPNGIPDIAELLLLERVLTDSTIDFGAVYGIRHVFAWEAWEQNLSSIVQSAPELDPRIQRIVAGYICFGDTPSEKLMQSLLQKHFPDTVLNTGDFDSSLMGYFLPGSGDPDNSGSSNLQEWNAIEKTGTLADMLGFADAALDGARSADPPTPPAGAGDAWNEKS